MTFWNYVSLIGTIVSIVSAVFGFYQAHKAKQHKMDVETIRDEMTQKYAHYEYSQLRSDINRVLREISNKRTNLNFGNKLINDVSSLVTRIKCEDLYNDEMVRDAVAKCDAFITEENGEKCLSNISNLIDGLSDVSRFIDGSIRR